MEKPDFSDFHKFLVSVGILVIALSTMFLWFIFSQNEIFLLSKETINSLTSNGSMIINRKQNDLIWIYENKYYVSIILFVFGLSILIFGLIKWTKRQEILDKLQDNELQKSEYEIGTLSKLEINKKYKKEIMENDGIEPNIVIENEEKEISQYENIEKMIINEFINQYNKYFNIRSNLKINNNQYDLLLLPTRIEQNAIVVEIKYYKNKIVYSYLMNGLRRFLYSIDILKNYLNEKSIIVSKLNILVLWVCETEEQFEKLKKYENIAMHEEEFSNMKYKIIAIKSNQIENIFKRIL